MTIVAALSGIFARQPLFPAPLLSPPRLLPTTGPHIFGDLFPHLADGDKVPTGEDILELTRFYVAPFGSNRHQRWWFVGIISIGMFEYCLRNGIKQISSVIDTFLLPQMLELGWKVRPLGPAGRLRTRHGGRCAD